MLLELVDMTQGAFSRQQILEYLCAVEEKASHPVAQAILKGAQSEEVSFPKHFEVKDHKILKGEGVEGVVNGLRVVSATSVSLLDWACSREKTRTAQ